MKNISKKMVGFTMQNVGYVPFILGILLLSFSWLPTGVSAPNERSRIYLAVSIIDHHIFSIDEAIERFGSVSDRAERDGVSYTDKAPGSSLLAALVYGALSLVVAGEEFSIEALFLVMRFGLMIPLTFIGFLILRQLLRTLGIKDPIIDLASLGWLVASPVLHYGQAFYGHQIVGVALLGAVSCLLQAERKIWHFALAGVCAGIAGLTEYQAGIACIVIAFWVLLSQWRLRPTNLGAFVGGALPFALLFFFYHNISFGGPLELSYHHLANASLDARHTEGIGGVFLPSWEAIYGSLFSWHRGLFITAPIFLFVFMGMKAMAEKIGRQSAFMLGIILVYFILFICSSNTWFAGWSYGPRLLVSTLSIAAIPLAFGLERAQQHKILGPLAIAAFIIGVISNLLMKLTFFEVPPSSTNPLIDVALPMVGSQMSSPSLLTIVGVSSEVSIAIAVLVAMVLVLMVVWKYMADSQSQLLMWAIAIVFVFGSIIYSQGPSWDEEQSDRFEAFVWRVID